MTLLVGTVLVVMLVGAGVAAAHLLTVTPGYEPEDVNPHFLPLSGGSPNPDRLGGDHTASGDPPDNCWNAGPVNGAYRGTLALQRYIDHWYRGSSAGIYNCRTVSGSSTVSLHAEGRALDWRLYSWVPEERRAARRIREFLLRRDSEDRRRAGARRWGVQQIIYNGHHWSASHPKARWHACEWDCGHADHMHIEQNWRGARRRTTAFSGYDLNHTHCRAAAVPC